MASITPINTATDTPSSAADKTNANELAINTEVIVNNAKISYPAADSDKVAHISVTQAVDLDTMESDITTNNAKISYTDSAAVALNTAKVTNATHTGDVTGSTTLTINDTAISGKTDVGSLAGTEEVLVNEAGTLKKTTTQDIADLGGGGNVEYAMISGTATRSVSSSSAVPLDTENYDTGNNLTLSSNQFTLLAGTYLVDGAYLTFGSNYDYGYIYNVSDSVTEYKGGVCQSDTGSPSVTTGSMAGIITIASTKTFELRSGLGTASITISGAGYVDHLKFTKIA